MNWEDRYRSSFLSDVDRLRFQPQENTCIQVLELRDPNITVHTSDKLADHQIHDWLRQNSNQLPLKGLRLVLSYRAADATLGPDELDSDTLNVIPLSRRTFLDIVEYFQLSRSFVRTLVRGRIHFSSSNLDGPVTGYPLLRGYDMRMASAWPGDLAMSATANLKTGITTAILHGCNEKDIQTLTDWTRLTEVSCGHPMQLPALFAELQLKRHKQLGRANWISLVTLYATTGQYETGEQGQLPETTQDSQVNYKSTIKEVLSMYQNAGFLEQGLSQSQLRIKQMIAEVIFIEKEAPEDRKVYLTAEGNRIKSRLGEIFGDYDRLIGECKLTRDGASMLTGAIWNLIAQHDMHAQQSIAAGSRELAAAAMRDTSAMKTVAILSMSFLPGTFVAAFFSMPLFNWQAPPGHSVVSDRFWIYWAVTIPLTIGVFTLWATWHLVFGSQAAAEKPEQPINKASAGQIMAYLMTKRSLRHSNGPVSSIPRATV